MLGSRPFRKAVAGSVCLVLLAGCGAGGGSTASPGSTAAAVQLVKTTPIAKGDAGVVNWGLTYEPVSLDPAHSGNYAENQVIANLCDTLLRLTPDSTVIPNLATKTSNPTPTTWVFDLNPAAQFWDGTPVTPDDVIYSLMRHKDASISSYYGGYFEFVDSVTATGPNQITVTLTQADEQFLSAMSSPASAVIKKAYSESKGTDYGSPSGGVMCSGPFAFKEWIPGKTISMVRNDNYWNKDSVAKSKEFVFSFISDGATRISALQSGQIDGAYQIPWEGLGLLSTSTSGHLYFGPSSIVASMLVADDSGPIGDPRIREALSLALDRAGIIATAFSGYAVPVKAFTPSQTWTYAPDTFAKAWDALPDLNRDLEKAKQLVKDAGSPTDPIVVVTASGASSFNEQISAAIQQAGKDIGLNVQLKDMPVKTFQTLFFDPEARKGVSLFESDWYPDLMDPLNWYINFTTGNFNNYFGYENADLNTAISQARQTADDTARADLVVKAQAIAMQDLPWLPLAGEPNTLYMNNRITGAPGSFVELVYPWAVGVGTP
jgi:peptide/nickel transport system substrate-binding protein